MDKITIKKIPFKLKGEIISIGSILKFKAINRKNEDSNINDIKGIKIISFFPDINTKVCDMQTHAISEYADKYKNVLFISITMDDVEIINKWCLANSIDNIDIWSDKKYGEFGNVTNTLIPKISKLARGFIVLNEENKIIDLSIKKELSENPDYSILDKHIK